MGGQLSRVRLCLYCRTETPLPEIYGFERPHCQKTICNNRSKTKQTEELLLFSQHILHRWQGRLRSSISAYSPRQLRGDLAVREHLVHVHFDRCEPLKREGTDWDARDESGCRKHPWQHFDFTYEPRTFNNVSEIAAGNLEI